MKCPDAEKWMLLQDSGEMPFKRENELAAHLHDCEPCQRFQHALIESRAVCGPSEEPSAPALQKVLREARLSAPEKARRPLWVLKPALAAVAACVIALGLFFTAFGPEKVGMELVVTETQLMESDDQMVSVMYDGYSDDDLAFSFLMTYDGAYASL